MRVFISWSGATSRLVAAALRDWLKSVIQAVEPWMSTEDIDKGTRWSADIAAQLKAAAVGIICLTKDNLEQPWVLFEAGALSKTLEKTFVCPYLFGIRPTDLRGPLVQFQASEATREDTWKLVQTINRALDSGALPEGQLEKSFNVWWPQLEKAFGQIPTEKALKSVRTDRDLLEEILSIARNISRQQEQSTRRSPGPIIEVTREETRENKDFAQVLAEFEDDSNKAS